MRPTSSARLRATSLALFAWATLATLPGCRTPSPVATGTNAISPINSTLSSASSSPSNAITNTTPTPTAAPRLHDLTDIRLSTQDASGLIWGIGWLQGDSVAYWTSQGWRKVEDASSWSGSALDLLADPADPQAAVSLWSGPPQTSGNFSVLHVWRHRAGQPSVLQASFPNPTAHPNRRDGDLPRLAVGPLGEVWITFPAPLVVRLPREASTPTLLSLDDSAFIPEAGDRVSTHRPLVFTPTGPDQGWLWSAVNEGRQTRAGRLHRPLLLTGDTVVPCPPLAGLPSEGAVTLIAPTAKTGHTVWALENGELFNVDASTLTATARPGPPDAWRVLDHATPSPDVEVALVVTPRREATRLVGNIWIRHNHGAWRDAGPSGDIQATFPGPGGWRLRARSWLVQDGALLGAGFYQGLVQIDLADPTSPTRRLGWAEHQPVHQPAHLHRTPDGGVLIHGVGTLHAPSGSLRRNWELPASEQARTLETHPVRAPDGRLWVWHTRGIGAPAVQHWDGQLWHTWPAPTERDWWPQEGLWVDAAGRVALLPESIDRPAWEHAPDEPGGWRRWASARELIESRAVEALPVLPPVSEGFRKLPVFSGDGRALIGIGAGLSVFADGQWTRFTQRELGTAPFRYGFEDGPEGPAWFYTNQRKRVLGPDGVWTQLPERVIEDTSMRSRREDWPDWLRAHLATTGASSAHRDEDGVWWLLRDGELWQGRAGELARVFDHDEASPFRAGRGLNFYAVHVDANGHRFFQSSPHVLLPARPGPKLTLEPVPVTPPFDRALRVGGEPRLRFEWRQGDGPWQRGESDHVVWRELPVGVTTFQLRGISRRLDPGPVYTVPFTLAYDPAARIAALLAELASPDYPTRAEAVRRLAKRGEEALPALEQALATAKEDTVRWWLAAARQAIQDEAARVAR